MELDAYRLKSRGRGLWDGRPYHWWRSLRDRRALRDVLAAHGDGVQRQVASRVALLFIGTNRYVEFFPRWHASLERFFLPRTEKGFFVFTDRIDEPFLRKSPLVRVVPVAHQRFPLVNLLKFQMINSAASALEDFSHVVYVDADMHAVSEICEEELFCHNKPLFCVQHYNCVRRTPPDAFERRPASRAALQPGDDSSTYWQACFWVGSVTPSSRQAVSSRLARMTISLGALSPSGGRVVSQQVPDRAQGRRVHVSPQLCLAPRQAPPSR